MSNQYLGEICWDNEWQVYYWDKVKANIVADGHTKYGVRVHVIDTDQPPIIVDNALVIGLGYLGEG